MSLLAVDPAAGKEQFEGPGPANSPWKGLRAACSRNDPQPDLGQPKPDILRSNPNVAAECDLNA